MGQKNKHEIRERKRRRVRKLVVGTQTRPRLCVFKSLQYTYAQLISDETGHVLCSTSSKSLPAAVSKKSKDAASSVGKKIAELAKEKNISNVVFDRNGYLYHGRIAAVAEGAREGGLNF